MKYLFSSMLLLVFYTNSYSQLGVSGQYHSQGTPVYFTKADKPNEDNISFIGGGLDYTFRLKNYRIEFFPTLVYLNGSSKYPDETSLGEKTLNITTLGIQFNTHFYLFDIEGDCHCPTWSKDGAFLKKGFFLSLSINGYNSMFKQESNADISLTYGAVAIGAGIDIGIAKKLTLTPSIQYELQQRKTISPGFTSSNTEQNTVSNLILGLRLGYSFKDH